MNAGWVGGVALSCREGKDVPSNGRVPLRYIPMLNPGDFEARFAQLKKAVEPWIRIQLTLASTYFDGFRGCACTHKEYLKVLPMLEGYLAHSRMKLFYDIGGQVVPVSVQAVPASGDSIRGGEDSGDLDCTFVVIALDPDNHPIKRLASLPYYPFVIPARTEEQAVGAIQRGQMNQAANP